MVGVETSTGVGHPKKLVQRASRGLGKTFFTRKKPVKYAMDGLLVRLGPLQTFCGGFVLFRADPADLVEPLFGFMMKKKQSESAQLCWLCTYLTAPKVLLINNFKADTPRGATS